MTFSSSPSALCVTEAPELPISDEAETPAADKHPIPVPQPPSIAFPLAKPPAAPHPLDKVC